MTKTHILAPCNHIAAATVVGFDVAVVTRVVIVASGFKNFSWNLESYSNSIPVGFKNLSWNLES